MAACLLYEVNKGGVDPRARLAAIVPALEAWFRSGRFYGCSFMNAAAEHSKGEPALRELAAEHHRVVLAFLEQIVREIGVAEPLLVARQILLTVEGTIASLMVAGDPAVLEIAARNLRGILAENGVLA